MKVNKKMLTAGVFMGLCLFTMTNVSALEDNVNTDNQEVITYQVSDDEEIFTGWKEIDGYKYYFDDNGVMYANRGDYIDGFYYQFDANGHMITGWLEGDTTPQGTKWYYFDKETGIRAEDDWYVIDGEKYYFFSDGNMAFDTSFYIGGVYYYFDANGHLYNGWKSEGAYAWQYFDHGARVEGEYRVGNINYFFKNGYLAYNYSGSYSDSYYDYLKNEHVLITKYYKTNSKGEITYSVDLNEGFNFVNGEWYYVENGIVLTNEFKEIDGYMYYFDYDGIMARNSSHYNYEDHLYYAFDNNGHALKNTWSTDWSGHWYYYDETGARVSGVKNINGIDYLFSEDEYEQGRLLQSESSVVVYNELYSTNKDGVVISHITADEDGWKYLNGQYYYVKDNYFLENAFIEENGVKYYFGAHSVMTKNSSITTFSDQGMGVYAFDESGAMLKNTWYFDVKDLSSNWYYLGNDGKAIQGWQEIDGDRYYFTPFMMTNVFEIDGKYYLFDESGKFLREVNTDNGWNEHFGTWYYIENGKVLENEWRYLGNSWYYFDYNGNMAKNSTKYLQSTNYYFNNSGAMVTNQWIDNGYGDWFYASNSGALVQNSWLQLGNDWYYFDGIDMNTENIRIDDSVYYFNANGKWNGKSTSYGQLNGWVEFYDGWYYFNQGESSNRGWNFIDGSWYYFNKYDGRMLTGFIKDDNNDFYCLNSDGHIVYNQWIQDEYGRWYYTSNSGTVLKGWQYLNNKWYYFDEYPGDIYSAAESCVKNIDGTCYVFDENCALVKEYKPYDGWNLVNGEYYYFINGNLFKNNVLKIDGSYYEFDQNGRMLSNEVGYDHIYNSNGQMVINSWYQLGNDWYYANTNGHLYRNEERVINGVKCTFNSDGILI